MPKTKRSTQPPDAWFASLPNPKNIGQSEYRVLHEFVGDILADEEDNADLRDLIISSMREIEGWAQMLRNRARSLRPRDVCRSCKSPFGEGETARSQSDPSQCYDCYTTGED